MSGDHVELEGLVIEEFAGGNFKVQMTTVTEDNNIVMASLSGKMRNNKIRVLIGDSVRVRFSPYDLTRGQIVYRGK